MVCNVLVVGGRLLGAEQQAVHFPHPGRIACCPASGRRPPATKALHTINGKLFGKKLLNMKFLL